MFGREENLLGSSPLSSPSSYDDSTWTKRLVAITICEKVHDLRKLAMLRHSHICEGTNFKQNYVRDKT